MLRVALLSSASETIYALFLRACGEELWRNQIDVAAAILDENTAKKQDFLRHSVRVAKRQARCVARFWPVQYLNILAYKIAIRPSISPVSSAEEAADRDVPIHRVGSLNSAECVELLRRIKPDVACLMGTRIITEATLGHLPGVKFLNVHSSDPSFVRGGPPVFWEVLSGKTSMTLTVHRVTPELDGGEVLAQQDVPILFQPRLGDTVAATMAQARPAIARLFLRALVDERQGRAQPRKVPLGPLRVTPSVIEQWRAARLCRRAAGSNGFRAP